VLLTDLGGGVFGNDDRWINAAIERALGIVEHAALDIRIVCYQGVEPDVQALVDRWAEAS